MKVQPDINQQDLIDHLKAAYDLVIKDALFSPGGEDAYGYILRDEAGKGYYLKVYRRTLNWAAVLGIPAQLHQHGLTEVVHALSTTDGALNTQMDTYPMALYPLMDAPDAVKKPFKAAQLRLLGQFLARMHALTPQINPLPEKEAFSRPQWTASYREILAFIPDALHSDDLYRRELAQTLAPIQARLEQELALFLDYGERARQQNAPSVICHADPSIGNVLSDDAGRIYIIDWDGILLAPKERDLMHFGADDQPASAPVFEGYREVAGDVEINQTIIQFYRHEWNIQEVVDYGARLFFEDTPIVQKEHDLYEIKVFLDYSGLG